MDIAGYALIVGGGSGIGRACALGLAKDGASGVMVADLDIDSANEVASACKSSAINPNFRVRSIVVDVTLEESVKHAAEDTAEAFGRIDYCVNCAGIGVQSDREIAEANTAEFTRFMNVNVTGTFHVLRAVSAIMKLQDPKPVSVASTDRGVSRGVIVTMGSASSFVSTPRMVQYTTSKHAVLGLSKNAALDNAAYSIRVNCICPSWVDTPMMQRAIAGVPGLEQMINSMVPLGRMARPEEVADAVIFLCSPRSRAIGFVTDGFPAPGLTRTRRHITGHNEEGKSVFLTTDSGDHHRVMGEQQAVANILYSTMETPIELNGNVDIQHAKEHEPPLHYHNGTVLRMIDFGPGVESPLHRAISLDYGVVLEGVFQITLDSGESRIMRPGDVSIQRATSHKWKNLTGNGTLPGRMLYVLLDCKDVIVNGSKVEGFLGELEKEYKGRGQY
ncbi:hypothetical protein F4819DRAFT_494345 [Hypoxylon fuscum]|nr:hypothetical protein F4819DRAFT_494345 [Hypoxylon fuscum]